MPVIWDSTLLKSVVGFTAAGILVLRMRRGRLDRTAWLQIAIFVVGATVASTLLRVIGL